MSIKTKFKKVCNKLVDRLEDGCERVISSSVLATMEKRLIGGNYMPRGYKPKAKDRLCSCPKPVEGAMVDRIQYCGICQGVIEVVA